MGEKLKRLELLKDIVQQAIERGATSVQQIHEYIGDLPFEALDRAGLLDSRARKLQHRHHRTVGMVYDAIRRINREVGQLISDQIENLEDGHAAARVFGAGDDAPAPQAEPVKRATPRKAPARKAAAAAKPASPKAPAKKAARRKSASRKSPPRTPQG